MSRSLFLMDTSVLVLLVRGGKLAETIDVRFGLKQADRAQLISVVTHGEIGVFARRNRWGEGKLSTLQNAIANLVTVDIGHPDVIQAYIEIELFSQGHVDGARNMSKNDLWIAAYAKAAGAILLSADKDFDHLSPELLQVEWIDQRPVL